MVTINKTDRIQIQHDGLAKGIIPVSGDKNKFIKVFGSQAICENMEAECIAQAINARLAPGVTDLILNPDAHIGYGTPIGCVLVSPSHIYPGPVGVDIKCSMSLLQTNLPKNEILSASVRKALMDEITARIPTGAGKGQRSVKKSRRFDFNVSKECIVHGADDKILKRFGIPLHWKFKCEDPSFFGHDGTTFSLEHRMNELLTSGTSFDFNEKFQQLGSYGSGNHFGECEIVSIENDNISREISQKFGLLDNCAGFLSHCGSRGFGYTLANEQFKFLQNRFINKGIPFPGNDKQLVYCVLGTPEANDYLDDMALASNFATMNHLLINSLVLEAFQEIFPGVEGNLIYLISHNIARKENINGIDYWIHRKGSTRAFPAFHNELKSSEFETIGHPILLPGNPKAGSAIMVALEKASESFYSINHGAGRQMGRRAAFRNLDQKEIDKDFKDNDIMSNCPFYPKDEAPSVYKDFEEVITSVEKAGLAKKIASLNAKFVIKDSDKRYGGAA